MESYLVDQKDLTNQYHTDETQGLTEEQVAQSKKEHGINELTRQKPPSLLKRIWEAATEPIILMLIFAGIIAVVVNIIRSLTGVETDFLECVGIFLAISLSVSISVFMEGRSQKAFEALNDISNNIVIKAIRGGEVIVLKQNDIAVGDILLLSTGDKIPADGRLLESTDLNVDESSLTGESNPVYKFTGFIAKPKTPLAERANMLYAGTYIVGGNARVVVTAVGDSTEMGKIASELQEDTRRSTPLQEKLLRLGKLITVLGIIAASIVFCCEIISFILTGTLTLERVLDAFVTSVVLIVAAVPEGLPTIVAVSLSLNIIKLSRKNALVKKMIASETIGCINVICSDKTGTLTENRMSVRNFYDADREKNQKTLENNWVAENICLNTTADLGPDGSFIGNPTECALLSFYENSDERKKLGRSYQSEREARKILHTYPFSSELKHMTTVAEVDGRDFAFIKGSPEYIFSVSDLSPEEQKNIESEITEMQKKAMRIIAFAHKELPEKDLDFSSETDHQLIEQNMNFDGFVAIADPLRKEVGEAVKACKSAGINLKMLTGDNITTAEAIANELDILSGKSIVMAANDIEELTDEELRDALPDIAVIARSTPAIKRRVVSLLKENGNVVAVTGDGINDAPALKNADVGIAMGISGTEVAKEASDIVLLNDAFSTIVEAVEWGRNIYENFKRFISFQLTVNVASVIVVFFSILLGLAAPFNALQLLWINIIMDGPPALTLGLEPNYNDLMARLPTDRAENIITKPILTRIILMASYMSAIFLLEYTTNFLRVPQNELMTALFTLFVLFQLFNSFNCRELHTESIFKHFFENKLMLVVVSTTFILQVVFIQYFGAFFNTVPLSLSTWIKLILVAITVIIVSELVRLGMRYFRSRRKHTKSVETA